MMDQQQLINKYDVPVPRYTSYPPANHFTELDHSSYLKAVEESNHSTSRNISFYLHMPFCQRLCHYCGCNSYAMAGKEIVNDYISSLHQEIDLVASHIDRNRPISQIHYGGGSPTAMSTTVLKELNDHLLSLFPTIDRPEIAIECHPGFLSHQAWEQLTDCGFNRFSIGIQDFDPRVLRAVNREPALLPLEEIFAILRQAGASINMDFLYGLPYQTADSFRDTIQKAIELRPDRLVTFSYGHLPRLFKRQLVLERFGLPDKDEKAKMAAAAASLLVSNGYVPIGLDHFVLHSDELYQALNTKKLHRNFQGYCTRRTTGQVYAFGVTGISQLDFAYAQNGKDIHEYICQLQKGELNTQKGYLLNRQEKITGQVIECLMCNNYLCWQELADTLHLTTDALKESVNYDTRRLQEMADDGIITLTEQTIEVTAVGKPFVRNVAATLDPLMRQPTHHYSKPI